jgi:hypothetical protein
MGLGLTAITPAHNRVCKISQHSLLLKQVWCEGGLTLRDWPLRMCAMPAITNRDKSCEHSFFRVVVLLILCFVFALMFSFHTGAMDSDLGGDPDEAAHAVTSLMMRDYFASGFGQHPMKFARAYYEHFPRVALGHYPPFYYLVSGLLLLPFPSSQVLIILQAFLLASLAAVTFHFGRRFLPQWLAALAAGLGCMLPVGLKLAQHVMSDVLLAVLCLGAVVVWADYLRVATFKKALLWGCIAAAAILTKGSGMLLCLVPPVATVLAGRWRLIRTFSWWCAALPVVVLAGPWMLYSTSISKEGMTQLTPGQYFIEAVPYYIDSVPAVFGWGITLLAMVGAGFGLHLTWSKRVMSCEGAAMTGLLAGALAVLVLVPVGLSTRYMLTLVPVIMLAAAYGILAVFRYLPVRIGGLLGALMLLAAFTLAASLPNKEVHGFAKAVRFVGVPTLTEPKENWLVSSDPRGEGAIIAAATFQITSRSPSNLRVYRGSKELASSDWMGRDYKTAVDTSADVLKLLDARHITWVFVDLSSRDDQRRAHDRLLADSLQSTPQKWKLVKEQSIIRRPDQKGRLLIYHRAPVP